MEGIRIPTQQINHLLHLPSFLFIIGYPTFWLELYVFDVNGGRTTYCAWATAAVIFTFYIYRFQVAIKSALEGGAQWFHGLPFFSRLLIGAGTTIGAFILIIAFYASLYPVHLQQELDALNYHYLIPRQHLIVSSFAHLPWSSADLFLLPVDFALAPFWLSTPLLNKLPQFLCLLGLITISMHLAFITGGRNPLIPVLVCWLILGSHGIGIQMGTAMLDIVNAYLFIAALHSLLSRQYLLGMTEFCFFFWAKPLLPVQGLVVITGLVLCIFILKKLGFKNDSWPNLTADDEHMKRQRLFSIILFLLLSVLMAGPFIMKSIRWAGTPLFPLAVGLLDTPNQTKNQLNAVKIAADKLLEAKDAYGYGRSAEAFIQHLWLLAVPDSGVNNKFDYPLGLPFLLVLGPLAGIFLTNLFQKKYDLIHLIIVMLWLSWWLSTQQSRFLYIPLILMFISSTRTGAVRSTVFMLCLMVALIFTAISLYRAHNQDLFRMPVDVLREKDRMLIELAKSKEGDETVNLGFIDGAYAQFPIKVEADSPFVIAAQP